MPMPAAASAIRDGAASVTLPAAEAFAVHYPGHPSSPADSLGGLPAIAKVRSSGPGARLALRFRPEDPCCHPAFGEPRASAGLVLRLSRPKGDGAPPRAQVVARVRNAYLFQDILGEGFSSGHLKEVVRSFPLDEDGHNKLGDARHSAEASDGEFEIYEQPSDDEEYSDG